VSNLGFNFGPDVRPLAARMRPTTLDESTFEFTPPEGVEIDDQSNGE